MIIGESNLIIGKIFTVISSLSASTFYYFEKSSEFFVKIFRDLIIKISQRSNSPPVKI